MLALEQRVKARYKKQLQRIENRRQGIKSNSEIVSPAAATTPSISMIEESPRTKTRKMIRDCKNVPQSVKKTLLFHNIIVREISRQSKSIDGDIVRRCRIKRHINNSRGVHTGEKGPKRGHTALDQTTNQMIIDLFERDDNSRLTTGQKETVTRNKVRKQKRLMTDTMINLQEKYCAENIDNIVSYISLTRLRPF